MIGPSAAAPLPTALPCTDDDALRREVARTRLCLDTATVLLLGLDLNARVTLVNRFACATIGRTEEELLGADWIDTCHPVRDRAAIRARFLEVVEGDGAPVRAALLTKSGKERTIEWRNTLVRDENGVVTGTFSSGADVTQQDDSARALVVAEERMRFALEAAGVGIWDQDQATGVLSWSPILEAQYGLASGTFPGTFEAFIGAIHPDDRERVLETVGGAMKTGADFIVNHRAIRPDGSVRWMSGSGRIKLGPDGAPIRAIGISQDVTERHAFEVQYQQAQKMEAVGRLASGIAHDFNNLLAVIHGCAELAAVEAPEGGEQAEDIAEILKAAQRAAGLTRQLLAFGRQQVLRTESLDLNRLVDEMSAMMRRLIGDDIEIVLRLTASLAPVLADRSQLEQVLLNLVVNARDAMPTGGKVTIQTTETELDSSFFQDTVAVQPGRYVMLAISDTGEGMTKETQRRLFEPFFTTKLLGKGIGLGLATTYGIVKQSKGYIWVYSDLGHGTTFKVYLPRADGGADMQSEGGVSAVSVATPGSETVLLVEDEEGVRRLSKRILENAGYRVVEAANGDEGAKAYAEHDGSIDLVIADVVMPGCGGPEMMERLRVSAPGLRALYMSGNIDHFSGRTPGSGERLKFVQKPFTAAEFLRQVRTELQR